jgi:hypothetical protein
MTNRTSAISGWCRREGFIISSQLARRSSQPPLRRSLLPTPAWECQRRADSHACHATWPTVTRRTRVGLGKGCKRTYPWAPCNSHSPAHHARWSISSRIVADERPLDGIGLRGIALARTAPLPLRLVSQVRLPPHPASGGGSCAWLELVRSAPTDRRPPLSDWACPAQMTRGPADSGPSACVRGASSPANRLSLAGHGRPQCLPSSGPPQVR